MPFHLLSNCVGFLFKKTKREFNAAYKSLRRCQSFGSKKRTSPCPGVFTKTDAGSFLHPRSTHRCSWTGVQALLSEARGEDDTERVCPCFFTGNRCPSAPTAYALEGYHIFKGNRNAEVSVHTGSRGCMLKLRQVTTGKKNNKKKK